MGQGTLAKRDSKQAYRKGGAAEQAIHRHPLFPAIVALWFAALLGVGSLALSTSLIEALVLAGGIDAVVPAAAPPLGIKARLLLALFLGLAGAGAGYVLARRLAEAKDDAAPKVFKVAEADLDEPLFYVAPKQEDMQFEPDVAVSDAPIVAEAAPDVSQPLPEPQSEPKPAPVPTAAERIASADLTELSHVELIERLAIALQRRRARRDTAECVEIKADQDIVGGPVIRFPEFADRRTVRQIPPRPAARVAPQQTEQALRDALNALQRMSGGA